MPTQEDRKAFEEAIKQKDSAKIRQLLRRDDAKELLLMKDQDGWLPIHDACCFEVNESCLQLILDATVEYEIIKQMLEGKDKDGWTCLHFACFDNLSINSLRLLLEYMSKHADMKKILEEKTNTGSTCFHCACYHNLSTDSLRLLLEYLSKHADIKQMLEDKTDNGKTCFHFACLHNLSTDSLCLLFEHVSKHSDIKKVLEEKDNFGLTCLHFACGRNLSPDSPHLLISFFPSNESLQLVLSSKDSKNNTPFDLASTEEHKQLLQNPDCWQKCRCWLFRKYQDTFLNSLYPNSPEKTLEALKELNKNYDDDETLKKAVSQQQNLIEALHIIHHDECAARQALELTAMSTVVLFHEDFHRSHITQQENAEVRQLITNFRKLKLISEEERDREELELAALSTTEDYHRAHIRREQNAEAQRLIADLQTQVMLLRDELDRQEFKKFIFDRLPITGPNKEAIFILQENHVTKESFFLLNENHLKEMGVKIGPRVQLLQIIEQETFRRNNLSARSDISSRPRSPGHTLIIDGVPPINLSASGLIQRYQEQQPKPPDVMSFAATETEVSENGGSFKPQTHSTAEKF